MAQPHNVRFSGQKLSALVLCHPFFYGRIVRYESLKEILERRVFLKIVDRKFWGLPLPRSPVISVYRGLIMAILGLFLTLSLTGCGLKIPLLSRIPIPNKVSAIHFP